VEMTLEDIRQVEAGFHTDRYAGLRGPISVDPSFLEALQRIDSRLVLRWIPWMRRYSVWLSLEHSHRLWPQPVHVIQTAEREFRRPDNRDLEAIRKANWMMRAEGADGFIREMDRAISARDGKLADEHRLRACQEWAARAAKKYDLTAADFGKVRGSLVAGNTNRHKAPPKKGMEV